MTNQTTHTIITDSDSAQMLVKNAEELGKKLAEGLGKDKLSTSQIRALFGEVRQIQGQWGMGEEQHKLAYRRLVLLKPKMAYRARKEKNRAVEELVKVLDSAVDEVIQEQDSDKQDGNFERFVEFFEAILAYHKAYGGN